MLRHRYLVTTEFLSPRLLQRVRRFRTRRAAARYALLFDREAWRAGFLTQSNVSDIT